MLYRCSRSTKKASEERVRRIKYPVDAPLRLLKFIAPGEELFSPHLMMLLDASNLLCDHRVLWLDQKGIRGAETLNIVASRCALAVV